VVQLVLCRLSLYFCSAAVDGVCLYMRECACAGDPLDCLLPLAPTKLAAAAGRRRRRRPAQYQVASAAPQTNQETAAPTALFLHLLRRSNAHGDPDSAADSIWPLVNLNVRKLENLEQLHGGYGIEIGARRGSPAQLQAKLNFG
jgi:hypothetical protein